MHGGGRREVVVGGLAARMWWRGCVRLGEGRWRAACENPKALIEHLEGVDERMLWGAGGGVNVVVAGQDLVGAWGGQSEDQSARKNRSRFCRYEFESRARRRRQIVGLSRALRGSQTSSHAERVGGARETRRATRVIADAGSAARLRHRGRYRIVRGCGRWERGRRGNPGRFPMRGRRTRQRWRHAGA